MRQCKDRYERPAMLFVIYKSRPMVFAYFHSTHEAICPIVGMGDSVLVLEKRQVDLPRLQGINNGIPVAIMRDKKSVNMGCAENWSSRTISPPQIFGRYSLGGTRSGQQIKAHKKPSSCSKFIARLSPKRSRTALRRSNSSSVNGFDFKGRPWLFLTIQTL